ncbi:ATP-dependent DNA helicase UvrD2 [Smaragdicoccus niigatensis]|uniref:ATP-dependent DNA helicase UvrD2 n=1 Tax=Smaragdicoccus niigatensis TaxID=359359 RepID=UPI00037C404E|nr:ATP-dependent DNA helicase UvrD2 [Smaragdicoccus niigatensis]
MMGGMRLDGLDPEQLAAVTAPRGPVCVLAGAGTGKTRTITHRIAHLVQRGHVVPSQVLAVTFTARAAGELRSRLRTLGLGGVANQVQARTFHAAAMRQLRYFWPKVVGDIEWQLLDSKFALVGQSARRVGLPSSTDDIRDLAAEIEWAKASLIAPEDYYKAVTREKRNVPAEAGKVAAVYDQYEEFKRRGDVMLLDFDDMLLHTAGALEDNEEIAIEFRDRYRSFVVDEFQDVTPLQQRVLDAWLGDRDDVTVVGDANQTIFSFTGATPKFLLNFTRKYPDATLVRLERDYRSTPQVVSLANRVIGGARGRIAGTRLQLIGQRPPGPEPVFTEHADEHAEAAAVAAKIKDLVDQGTSLSEIAVLYRINAQSELYEQALTELGIPYQVRGGEAFFHRAEVRQAITALRNTAARSDLPEEARSAEGLVKLVRATLVPLGLTNAEPEGTQARERWASLNALVTLTEELLSHTPDLSIDALMQDISARSEARHPPVVEGVTLASMHAAKGLEWDAVFLIGLCDGTLPISHVSGDSESGPDYEGLEEERRLLYVGVTRARTYLELSWALARNPGGRQGRRRSRFLTGLVPDNLPSARVVSDKQQRKRPTCRVCGKPLNGAASVLLGRCEECPSDLDLELLESLKAWRLEKSRELSVPAFVVFTDATLVAIAELAPADERALVGIPGIGAKKLERFGEDVLTIVKEKSAR